MPSASQETSLPPAGSSERLLNLAADARFPRGAVRLAQSQLSLSTRIRSIRSGVLMPAASMWGWIPWPNARCATAVSQPLTMATPSSVLQGA
jgi:hypothetical protein